MGGFVAGLGAALGLVAVIMATGAGADPTPVAASKPASGLSADVTPPVANPAVVSGNPGAAPLPVASAAPPVTPATTPTATVASSPPASVVTPVVANPGAAGTPNGWDRNNAQDVNQTCAACHGPKGEGGKGGEYPRLAGQIQAYMERQLHDFKDRHRINIPMFPYTQARELPEKDIRDITHFLAEQRVSVTVPAVEGNVAMGQEDYLAECAMCHGKEGEGKPQQEGSKKHGPALAEQYPLYLQRQLNLFATGERNNPAMREVMREVSAERMNNIVAFMVTLERHPGLAREQALETQRRILEIMQGLAAPAGGGSSQ
ncbi:MAG: c-type cytochrome [Magnetococcales bacterium]|nr:c-type cytochrome [Magnetococcales bacterium]